MKKTLLTLALLALPLPAVADKLDDLKAQGFAGDLVTAYGRGEREPVVPTADEVAESRNRRAEIIIR